jgi:hypothetical protein
MLLTNTIVAAICGSTLVSLPAFGQEHPMSKADISIEASGPFVENTNSDGAQRSATVNYRILGGYRFVFNKHNGVELSYTHNIQTYSLNSGSIGAKNNSQEVLAADAFRFSAKRWSPFVLASAAALIFGPKTVAGASTQTRLAYRYGDGADFNLKQRIFPRAAHRGVFYNSATFDSGGLNSLDWIPNRVKPAVVFGYNF